MPVLSGLRVIEFAGIGPAPYCAMLLADLGADVVRIDRLDGGNSAGLPLEPRFDLTNRGKRSVAIDLRRHDGVELALRFAAQADVLLEGYRPGVMERFGVGPDVCLARNPRLVYGRMTGWGQDGPLAPRAGHDIAYIAVTGALHAIGREGGPPAIPLNLLGDFGGGSLFLAVGVLAALLEARKTGQGQVVDAAIVDGVGSLLTLTHGLLAAGLWSDARGRNLLDSGCPWYDVYETRDGRHVAIGPIEPKFYAAFLEALGVDGTALPGQWDIARWPELREGIAAAFRGRTRDEWTARFERTDACVAPVLSLAEATRHPHTQARGGYVEVAGVTQPAPAPRFSRTPAATPGPPPVPGAQTRELLAEVGLGAAETEELLATGVVSLGAQPRRG